MTDSHSSAPLTCTNHYDTTEGVSRCARCLRPFCSDCTVLLAGRRYCADCKIEKLRDVESGAVAEGLALASIGSRFAAAIVDALAVSVPLGLLFSLSGLKAAIIQAVAGGSASPFAAIGGAYVAGLVQMPIVLAYEALMVARRGQTLGKMALGLVVVRPDGLPVSSQQAWIRGAVRQIFGATIFLIDYLPAFFNDQRKTVHDMLADTRVVTKKR